MADQKIAIERSTADQNATELMGTDLEQSGLRTERNRGNTKKGNRTENRQLWFPRICLWILCFSPKIKEAEHNGTKIERRKRNIMEVHACVEKDVNKHICLENMDFPESCFFRRSWRFRTWDVLSLVGKITRFLRKTCFWKTGQHSWCYRKTRNHACPEN